MSAAAGGAGESATSGPATATEGAFRRAEEQGRAAVIAYLPAGFPDVATSIRLIRAVIAAGADLVEVGVPYSDPVMDGPTICAAAEIALAAGTTSADALDVVAAVTGRGAAVLVMAYWNLIEQYGPERFAHDLAARGGAGVIAPDLTPEEAGEWIAACDLLGLDHVFLAAPSTPTARLPLLARWATGFVYAASLMGVTGVRAAVGRQARELVDRLRQAGAGRVAVGLGVSGGEQAHEIAGYADGVIVGSAYVRRVLDASDADAAVSAVTQLTRELVAGSARPTGTDAPRVQ